MCIKIYKNTNFYEEMSMIKLKFMNADYPLHFINQFQKCKNHGEHFARDIGA